MSFVDYVKTPAEILDDHTLGVQSKGTGDYLIASDFNKTSGLSFLSADGNSTILDIQGQTTGDWVLYN